MSQPIPTHTHTCTHAHQESQGLPANHRSVATSGEKRKEMKENKLFSFTVNNTIIQITFLYS